MCDESRFAEWAALARETAQQTKQPRQPPSTSIEAEIRFEIDYSISQCRRDMPSFLGREISTDMVRRFAEVGIRLQSTCRQTLVRWSFEFIEPS